MRSASCATASSVSAMRRSSCSSFAPDASPPSASTCERSVASIATSSSEGRSGSDARRSMLALTAASCASSASTRSSSLWIDVGSRRHRRNGAGELLDALAERADARGELADECGAAGFRALLHERCDGILERAELVDVRCRALCGRACRLRLRDQRLHRLVASLEVTAQARDLAVLLRHRRRGRRDGRGERVDALHEHVETRREARFLLRVALRGREHDSSRVPSTRAPLGTTSRRASSWTIGIRGRALAHSFE